MLESKKKKMTLSILEKLRKGGMPGMVPSMDEREEVGEEVDPMSEGPLPGMEISLDMAANPQASDRKKLPKKLPRRGA